MRVLGLDVGDRRIGVAVSDSDTRLAIPLTTIVRKGPAADTGEISDLIAREDITLLVVGLPISLDGTLGPQARRVEEFVARLRPAVEIPIEFWDERYSTAQADALLRERPRSRKAHERQDALAAAIILQDYLDSKKAA
jgi:putative Holliday junction resolvase